MVCEKVLKHLFKYIMYSVRLLQIQSSNLKCYRISKEKILTYVHSLVDFTLSSMYQREQITQCSILSSCVMK
jgi:hypothetical protein